MLVDSKNTESKGSFPNINGNSSSRKEMLVSESSPRSNKIIRNASKDHIVNVV